MFEGKFGSNGPSGRPNKTSRLFQKEQTFAMGSGLSSQERQSSTFRQKGFDIWNKRESKSIPRDSIAFDHIDPLMKFGEHNTSNNDKSFSDLIK